MLPNEVPPDWSRAKTGAGADPFAEIHKRLDQISEKMDRCLAEVAALAPRGAVPAPVPKRSNLLVAWRQDFYSCIASACASALCA